MKSENHRKNQSKKTRENLNHWAKYSGIAFQMGLFILAGVWGGQKLDEWLNMSNPVFTVILSLFAVIGGIYYAIKDFLKK